MEKSANNTPPETTLNPKDLYYPGSRIGVLLVHGLTGTPAEMKYVARRLNAYGFTVLCPCLAGHCGTMEELLKTSWRDWRKSVFDAGDWLARRTDVIFAGGLSAGAVFSLDLAQKAPDSVRALSLYSITLRWDGWSIPRFLYLISPIGLALPIINRHYSFKERFPYGIKDERLRRLIVAQMQSGDANLAGYEGTPWISLHRLRSIQRRVLERLPETDNPAIILHAREDDIASLWNPMQIKQRMRGHTELVLLDNSYHMITVDRERDRVADLTARFYARYMNEAEKRELASCARLPLAEEEGPCDDPAVPMRKLA